MAATRVRAHHSPAATRPATARPALARHRAQAQRRAGPPQAAAPHIITAHIASCLLLSLPKAGTQPGNYRGTTFSGSDGFVICTAAAPIAII